jgi:hypothetical protein
MNVVRIDGEERRKGREEKEAESIKKKKTYY